MKTLIKTEELAQFVFGIILFSAMDFKWWVFPALLLAPDIGMLGYLVNTKVGAFVYNLFHHRGVAIALMILGYFYLGEIIMLVGVILFSHIAFDRVLGYGLKYSDDFRNTHLGRIGKN